MLNIVTILFYIFFLISVLSFFAIQLSYKSKNVEKITRISINIHDISVIILFLLAGVMLCLR